MGTDVESGVEIPKPPHERGQLFRSHACVASREAFSCSTAVAVMND